MNATFINIIFLIFTLFILGKTISYGFYEFKVENNHLGGVSVIILSLIATLFSNITVWTS